MTTGKFVATFSRADLDEKLGRFESMAGAYGNLGIVLETRGDLDGAQELWTKARDLYRQIGMLHMVENVQSILDGLEGSKGDGSSPTE